MPTKPLLIVMLLVATALAGCGGKIPTTNTTSSTTTLQAGKGAISGLIIDDVYRPVPGALILVQEAGLTATADTSGQFSFVGLEPGSYILKVQAADHATAPQNVEVKAGQYTDVEIKADRLANGGAQILTREYSVFVPCAAGFIVNGVTFNCVLDLSGDSFRSSFTSNLNQTANVTYMVTEFKFNQAGYWNVQVREDNGSPSGGERYAVQDVANTDYAKVILQKGVLNTADNAQRNNVVWNATKPFSSAIFLNGEYKNEAQGAMDAACQPGQPLTCRQATGLGAAFGVRAKIVQSVFIGPPTVDLASYGVLQG